MTDHKPFDTSTRDMMRRSPIDWVQLVGLPGHSATMTDANLSTVTADADSAIVVESDYGPYVANLEIQSGHKAYGNLRTFKFNVLMHVKLEMPVESVVILLRPEAAGPGFTGRYLCTGPAGTKIEFEYHLLKVWEIPTDKLLAGGLSTLALAPISRVSPGQMLAVIAKMDQRLTELATPEQRIDILADTYLLMGLRYSSEFIHEQLKGMDEMRESTTYQEILREGEARGAATARRAIVLMGEKRFGAADENTLAAIDAMTSLHDLDRLMDRLFEVESWDELLPLA